MTLQRTNIAIFGADAAAFHVFNVIYKSDDRYDVIFFLDIDEEPTSDFPTRNPKCKKYQFYNSLVYTDGIPIIPYSANLLTILTDKGIKKCIFTPCCLTSSLYLHLAAQAMAAGALVYTHKLDDTLISPPKALVSYYADTQFDGDILIQIINRYIEMGNKPAIVFGGMESELESISKENGKQKGNAFIQIKNGNQLQKHIGLDLHTFRLFERLITLNISIFVVFDFEQFATESQLDNSYDLIIFAGFNSLPCFFSSHLTIYACDDFTFGKDVTEHPSYVLLKNSDVILYCGIESSQIPESLEKAAYSAKIVPIEMGIVAKDIALFRNKSAVLVDDAYPVIQCNATRSISEYIALHYQMRPIDIGTTPKQFPTLLSEPSHHKWNALICPDSNNNHSLEHKLNQLQNYDVVLSTTSRPLKVNINQKQKAFILQVNFTFKGELITKELLTLPSGAFVKRR